MPHRFIRSLTGKSRTRKADIQLGVMLAFVAGAVNAAGFLAVGKYTSHMTGMVSAIANYIALNRLDAALASLGFVLCFVAGATVSSMLIRWGKSRDRHSQFALALLLEAILLLAFGFSGSEDSSVTAVIMLLCFTMGLQNAIISKISNAEIRTTHVTGLATDIGIELGQYLLTYRDKDTTVPRYKLKLHSSLILSFLSGGIIGALSFNHYGFPAAIPLALVLIISASLPVADDLRKKNP